MERREYVDRCIALGELYILNSFLENWKVCTWLRLPEFLECMEIVESFLKRSKLFHIMEEDRAEKPFIYNIFYNF